MQQEPHEAHVAIVLADISGYTKCMVESHLSAVHGQTVITHLIESLLREVDIPLELQETEVDAVFLFARRVEPKRALRAQAAAVGQQPRVRVDPARCRPSYWTGRAMYGPRPSAAARNRSRPDSSVHTGCESSHDAL